MNRCRLPNRRMSLTLDFEHAMQPGESPRSYVLTIGFYPNGRVGEIFLDGVKIGSTLETHIDDGATLPSPILDDRAGNRVTARGAPAPGEPARWRSA